MEISSAEQSANRLDSRTGLLICGVSQRNRFHQLRPAVLATANVYLNLDADCP